ncbi:hypothetical protein BDV95DRAFT_558673 [Massariosphaeria phaeospora]|uniref:Short-chain dehydrogenases/reductase n=1 Tax=Massariosphaeria phaeospora TaxID=100035 RepID=A0A7C8MGU4_9PLEO|nr:hypothetical protein BDV95DRAFT_558673 [Massariosphaeria phaeospora]
MVPLPLIRQANTQLPADLTAVFVGATSGIGLYTLLSFARNCAHPRAYFIGRSQDAATSILASLKAINPNGEYTFIRSDISLLANVDTVCAQIVAQEKSINMLVMSQGTMVSGVDTSEGLHLTAALLIHSRTRFAVNLLPLLRAAPTLRRVLTIFTGTKEGKMKDPDLQMRSMGVNFIAARGQAASVITLSLEKLAKMAPDVSFVHDFPGPVKSNIAREGGIAMAVMRGVFWVVGRWVFIPEEESGDRHLWLATSGAFPAREREKGIDGGKVDVQKGSDGMVGSGVYIVDQHCESGGPPVVEVLRKLREEGQPDRIWTHIQDEFLRITGKERM